MGLVRSQKGPDVDSAGFNVHITRFYWCLMSSNAASMRVKTELIFSLMFRFVEVMFSSGPEVKLRIF